MISELAAERKEMTWLLSLSPLGLLGSTWLSLLSLTSPVSPSLSVSPGSSPSRFSPPCRILVHFDRLPVKQSEECSSVQGILYPCSVASTRIKDFPASDMRKKKGKTVERSETSTRCNLAPWQILNLSACKDASRWLRWNHDCCDCHRYQ